jgi:hypothetical protein
MRKSPYTTHTDPICTVEVFYQVIYPAIKNGAVVFDGHSYEKGGALATRLANGTMKLHQGNCYASLWEFGKQAYLKTHPNHVTDPDDPEYFMDAKYMAHLMLALSHRGYCFRVRRGVETFENPALWLSCNESMRLIEVNCYTSQIECNSLGIISVSVDKLGAA